MKNLMILGANTLQVPLILQAVKSGYDTVVVSPDKNETGFQYAVHKVYSDVCRKEEILKYAEEYKIQGVITDQTDIPVRTAAYVAEKMGLPGIGYESACLFTDKYLMREKCRELGIPTLKYKLVSDFSEAESFFEEIHESVILKPVDNQGSRGVCKVSSKEELEEKFDEAKKYSREGSVLVEQFVTGREFVVEGLAFNYNFLNLICGDTHYFNALDVFSATSRIFPSTAENELTERVKRLNERIITGFGLKQGITHSEFIMSNDEIYLIETAARGGGVFISSDLISLSTGLNTEDFLIKIATGTLDKAPVIKNSGKVSCYIAFYLPEGEVVSVEGINEAVALPYTHRNNLDSIFVGLKTKPFKDKTSRYFIIVSADSHRQLYEYVDRIRMILQIKVNANGEICEPVWK